MESKYYHRGNGEVVVPDENLVNYRHKKGDYPDLEDKFDKRKFWYLASLPVTHYCDSGLDIGFLGEVEEGYQRFIDGVDKWVDCKKVEYDSIAWQLHETHRRKFLSPKAEGEKEEDQDELWNAIAARVQGFENFRLYDYLMEELKSKYIITKR